MTSLAYTSTQQRDAHAALQKLYSAALRAACSLSTPAERRAACDAAHLEYEAGCEALGVVLADD